MDPEKLVPAVRLASHEIQALAQKRYREAKLKRLNQVRDQASKFAQHLRQESRCKRRSELSRLEREISEKAQTELKNIIHDLENDALTCLTEFGVAHSKADQENDADYDTARKVQLADNRRKAQRLGKDALRDLHLQKEEEEERRSGPLKARRQALDVEAVRSSYIISLPPVSYIQSKETAKEEEPPKVMLFDKSTLFQTEYAIKHKIVEEVSSPKDARRAALSCEAETQQLNLERERKKLVNDQVIQQRGREALVRQKSHTNYLRLLEELDKMQSCKKPEDNKDWDVESTVTTICDDSQPTKPPSPVWSDADDQIPVRDSPMIGARVDAVRRSAATKTSLPPPPKLGENEAEQLKEIGRLLQELKEEQERWSACNAQASRDVSSSVSESSRATSSKDNSSGVVVYSDDDVRIRCDVRPSASADLRPVKDVVNAVCRERIELESSSEQSRRPGILRRPPPPPRPAPAPIPPQNGSIATSTPLAEANRQPIRPVDDERKRALKHYISKLLEMKRAEVSKLSVSGSSSTTTTSALSSATSTSTPKPSSRPLPLSTSTSMMTPESVVCPPPGRPAPANWIQNGTDVSSSAYDSPATTDQSSSKVSNASSSLPLGAEASAFRKSNEGSSGVGNGDGLFSLAPILDVYNDVYQAYNQRMRALVAERSPPVSHPPWQQGVLTESSFMSLTLSGASSLEGSSAAPAERRLKSQSPFSFQLTLSSSSASSASPSSTCASRTNGWTGPAAPGKTKLSSFSSTLSCSSSTLASSKVSSPAHSSTTSSQNVSMPDVDEALRRLGLPSMQSVLRR